MHSKLQSETKLPRIIVSPLVPLNFGSSTNQSGQEIRKHRVGQAKCDKFARQ